MIITFGTQKGGVGKTTLAVAFSNYLALEGKQVKVYDFDFQKSFYNKWKEDELLEAPPLYPVQKIEENEQEILMDFQSLTQMKNSHDIYIVDLAGTLDERYIDILIYSDVIVIPFEYSDVSAKSTLVFVNILGMIESGAERVFLRSKYDKGYFYKNQEGMDAELKKYGEILKNPVYKRNTLQNITTRGLTYEQKYAVRETFDELKQYINEALQTTL